MSDDNININNDFADAIASAINSAAGAAEKKKKKNEESSFLEGLGFIQSQGWAGHLRYNEISRNIEKSAHIEELNSSPGVWTDNDEYRLKVLLHRAGIRAATNTVHELAMIVASERPFNPIKEHIEQIPEWDGVNRLDSWAIDYLGCEDTDYNRTVSRRFLIQMTARGLRPGCKADAMLILEGLQGKMKSTFLEALASPDLFSDSLPSLHNDKEASDHLQGVWLVEIAELDSLKKAGVDTIKRFLSRRVDSYRPAYGRNKISRDRQCVFVGTTNRGEYLTDYTGNRRFLPMRTGDIDIEGFKQVRAQLLAEAKRAVEQDEKYWFDPDEFEFIEREQEARRQIDPWEEELAEFLTGKFEVTNDEIYQALGLEEIWRRDRRIASRKNAVMQALGWEPFRRSNCRGFRIAIQDINPKKNDKNDTSDNTQEGTPVTPKPEEKQEDSTPNDISDNKNIYSSQSSDNINNKSKENVSFASSASSETITPSSERESDDDKEGGGDDNVVSFVSSEDDMLDDRVTCQECRHFLAKRERCFKYHCGVVRDLKRRCEGFKPRGGGVDVP